MSFPETVQIQIPNDGAVPPLAVAAIGPEVRIDQLAPGSKGYDFVRDPGAAFTANLEGSVNGRHWDVVVGLAASGQGAIPTHLNLLRANVSIGGALGATTDLRGAGVCQ
jgi:hypothetical protein